MSLTASISTSSESNSEFNELKQRIHQKLIAKLDLNRISELEGGVLRREIKSVVEHLCDSENTMLNRTERERLVEEVLDETFGLGPLEMLLKDPTISDILINGPHNIYVERNGRIQKTEVRFRDNSHLLQIIDRIVSKVGRRVDETCPMVDARLEDGSRVNAIIPPLALDGAAMSIRRFGSNPLRLENLLSFKAFTPEMVMLMEGAMKARLNIIISGGTGSGKTTLLNTLSSFIPNTDRIITIEDAAELQLQQDHVVRLETRPPNIEGKGQVERHRLGQELSAHAARANHHWRMPRRRGPGHVASDEHRPRRLDDDHPRQFTSGLYRSTGDDDHDVGIRIAGQSHADPDRQCREFDYSGQPPAGGQAKGDPHNGNRGNGKRNDCDARHLQIRARRGRRERPGGWPLCLHRHSTEVHGTSGINGCPPARQHLPRTGHAGGLGRYILDRHRSTWGTKTQSPLKY